MGLDNTISVLVFFISFFFGPFLLLLVMFIIEILK